MEHHNAYASFKIYGENVDCFIASQPLKKETDMGIEFDSVMHKYHSFRYPIYARGGMVNCSSPQAASAGLEVLLKGGNAMDAAVAAAAALTVVEPTSNGLAPTPLH